MIIQAKVKDIRYRLAQNAGSDAIHRNPMYAYTTTLLKDEAGLVGTGLTLTLGKGNDLVQGAAQHFADKLIGKDIFEIMHSFGMIYNTLANDEHLRWLGPHKGVIHLALASVTNACFDLWAKKLGLPLWKLLSTLSPEALVSLLDFSYIEDALSPTEALDMLRKEEPLRSSRLHITNTGYTAYNTSVGWFNYSEKEISENVRRAIDAGFAAFKLKLGSQDEERDIRRAHLVRKVAGDDVKIMLDVNQQWQIEQAIRMGKALSTMNPYWIEEPTHPDDLLGHQRIAAAVSPVKLAIGEHVPNVIAFKNYLQLKCVDFVQVDALRVGGVSEFIITSLLCRKFGIPVVPHVGDMGQLHQHLVLFNHLALGHEPLFLEYIPHLRDRFKHPAHVSGGIYHTPQEPGSSCDLIYP